MKKIISLVLSLCLMFCVFAGTGISVLAETDGYYTYKVENGEATITDVDYRISGDITIPSSLGSYPVTRLGDSSFSNLSNLTSITIPDSVKYIGDSAFAHCDGITKIVIPSSVISIGDRAFDYSNDINEVVVDDNNGYYSSIDGVLFNKTQTELKNAL